MNTTPLAKLDAGLLAIAQQTGASPQQILEAEKRVLKTICQKGPMPPEMADIVFRREQQAKPQRHKAKFTNRDAALTVFVPIVLTHIAWTYADKVLQYCVQHRLKQTVELSRSTKLLRKGYNDKLLSGYTLSDKRMFEQCADNFATLYARDFLILWFSVNARYKQLYPDEPLTDMKTDAYICILMCRYVREHDAKMQAIVNAKGIHIEHELLPLSDALAYCMKFFCGDQIITDDENIKTSMRIIRRRMDESEYIVKANFLDETDENRTRD